MATKAKTPNTPRGSPITANEPVSAVCYNKIEIDFVFDVVQAAKRIELDSYT